MQSRIIYGGSLTLSEWLVQPNSWWLLRNSGWSHVGHAREAESEQWVGDSRKALGKLIRRPHFLPPFENRQKEGRLFSKEQRNIEHILRVFCYIFWILFALGVPPNMHNQQ